MSYPYRNPRLQFDLPQPDQDSQLILNHETGRYLRIGLREFAWLNCLNGQTHVNEIASLLGEEATLVKELLRRLESARLICFSDEPVKCEPTHPPEPFKSATRCVEWTQFGQLRIPLGEAKFFLSRLSPMTKKIMSTPYVIVGIFLIISSLFLGVSQGWALISEVRNFHWSTWRIIAILIMFLGITFIHELGHAVACDFFGAPVRSFGIMIYYMQPAAYVDISDSWQLKNRWDRVVIASAGLYVQAITTGLGILFWTLLQAMGQRAEMLAMFCVMNVTIILLNVNPFVKLDGYWILSNAVGIPNLRDRAIEWSRAMMRYVFTQRLPRAADLRYNAALSMPPFSLSLLACFGFSSIIFGISMWAAGLGFLFRIARWMKLTTTNSYFAVGVVLATFGAVYLVRIFLVRHRHSQKRTVPTTVKKSVPLTLLMTYTIDHQLPIQLNPSISVIDNGNETITFAWPSPDALTLQVSGKLFDALPVLRNGSTTIQQLKNSDLWSPQIEQVIQQLWHHRYLRYSSDWVVSEENLRYTRQLGWFSLNSETRGNEVDRLLKLQQSSVTILGMGGLGTHMAWNLAACGIGEIHLVDGDTIEMTNLNRQLFYTPDDIGRLKVDIAAERLMQFNPQIRIRKTPKYLNNREEIVEVIQGSDFVVRALDTPVDTLVWVNDACVSLGIPYSGAGFLPYGTIVGPTVIPGVTPCIACMRESSRPRLDHGTGGTIAPLVFATAGLLAMEVVTYLAKLGKLQTTGRILAVNAPSMSFNFHDIPVNDNCSICGGRARMTSA